MKTTIKEITPQWAKHILATKNKRNRPENSASARSYALDMKSGNWILTHQGIAFDENGNLIDGQTRLAAVVLSGCTIRMMVTTGIPVEQGNRHDPTTTMDVVDRGRTRGIGQQLQLSHGWADGNRVAGVAKGIAQLYADAGQSLKLTTPLTLGILSCCEKSVRAMMKLSHLDRFACNSKALAALTVYHTAFPGKAAAFAESYITQIGWDQGCPQKALENWKRNNPTEYSNSHSVAVFATATALHYFHHGSKIKIIRPSDQARDWLTNLNPSLRDAVRKEIGQ